MSIRGFCRSLQLPASLIVLCSLPVDALADVVGYFRIENGGTVVQYDAAAPLLNPQRRSRDSR